MVDPLPLPKTRLEALTDGIFAVSMTLLVLDLHFPPHVFDLEASAWRALVAVLVRLDDYVISFVALCIFWLAHLRLLNRLREADIGFIWLNLVFLLLTMGINLCLLSLLERSPAWLRRDEHPLVVFGQTALVFYVAHLYLYAVMGLAFPDGATRAVMYLLWFAGLVLLYPLCRAYRSFKRRAAPESVVRLA